MKSRSVVIGFFVASSLLACGGGVGADGEQQPPSPAGGGSSRGGASGAATGGFAEPTASARAGRSGGLNLRRPESGGGTANVGVPVPQAGALPMRDPNLPGVDFEDGSWIQLGSSTGSGSFTAGGSGFAAGPAPTPGAESTGGAAGGERDVPIPK